MRTLLIAALVLPSVACWDGLRTETPSAIVAYAEAHGSGDLRLASTESIQVWVKTHQTLGAEIFHMCRSQPPGDATWGDTTEGRLCLAVKRESFWRFQANR